MAIKKTTATEEKKTTAAKTAKAETKTTAAKTTKTAAAKTTAAKTTAAAKTEEKAAPAKKPAAKKAAAKAVEAKVYIEFNGAKVPVDEIVENVKATYKANGGNDEIKSLEVYVQPNESAAYFVVNGEPTGNKMDVYFC